MKFNFFVIYISKYFHNRRIVDQNFFIMVIKICKGINKKRIECLKFILFVCLLIFQSIICQGSNFTMFIISYTPYLSFRIYKFTNTLTAS